MCLLFGGCIFVFYLYFVLLLFFKILTWRIEFSNTLMEPGRIFFFKFASQNLVLEQEGSQELHEQMLIATGRTMD